MSVVLPEPKPGWAALMAVAIFVVGMVVAVAFVLGLLAVASTRATINSSIEVRETKASPRPQPR